MSWPIAFCALWMLGGLVSIALADDAGTEVGIVDALAFMVLWPLLVCIALLWYGWLKGLSLFSERATK